MVYFLYYRRRSDNTYLYAYGPADRVTTEVVRGLLTAWLANNGFMSWEVGMWRLDVTGQLVAA